MNGGLAYLRTLQGVHMGGVAEDGGVDLPVFRQHDIPLLPSSGIKGALRWATEPPSDAARARREWQDLFGPEFDRDAAQSGQASIMGFGDGTLLALPVPSLKGLLAWATTPMLLARYRLLAADHGVTTPTDPLDYVQPAECVASPQCIVNVADRSVVVAKDLDLSVKKDEKTDAALAAWQRHIAERWFPPSFQGFFKERLMVVHETAMHYLLLHCTDVRPRIRRDVDGTVAAKMHWYEEYLCPHTLFALPWWTQRIAQANTSASAAGRWFARQKDSGLSLPMPPASLQLGGKASLGKGWIGFTHGVHQ